jgi:hypothetical protein
VVSSIGAGVAGVFRLIFSAAIASRAPLDRRVDLIRVDLSVMTVC